MSIELKIKSKHLAAEARIIKFEERKLKRHKRMAEARRLREHRLDKVRPAARSTHLAYGFLRGRAYRTIEDRRTRTAPNWNEVERMALKYGDTDSRTLKQAFAEWQSES